MTNFEIKKLDELLKQSTGEELKVLHKEIKLLTAPGENYGSVMLDLKVKIKRKSTEKEETLNLVAKLIPANEMLRIAFDVPVTFKKEIFAYKETIPALVEFQKEYGIPESKHYNNMFPKCYGARLSLDETKDEVDNDVALILENLKVKGFITEDRLKGFDFSASKVIIQSLARFHAVPVALKLLKPEVFKKKVVPCTVHNKGLEQVNEEVILAFRNSIMEGARDVPELKPYLSRIQKVVDDESNNPWVNWYKPNEPWATMCHYDIWTNNTMILRDQEGNTIENKLVDLQLMKYRSGTCDLVFFLLTSVINSVLDKHFDDFLKLYHQTFVETLADFKIDLAPFSWENFLLELNDAAPTELYNILEMLKAIFTEPGTIMNTSDTFQDSDWCRDDLLGPHHRRKMKETVLAIIKRGWM